MLWPLRLLTDTLFPFVETDGLAPAVTAKAAQQCVTYLRSLAPAGRSAAIGDAWCGTAGFAALKQQAVATQSLVLIYLHAPLHCESPRFCRSVLNADSLVTWLRQDRILGAAFSIHTAQGAQLQSVLQVTAFPAIAVLQPSGNSTLQLVLKLQGVAQCALSSLLPLLHAVQQRHQTVLTDLEVRRLQRHEESTLRSQQDDEYQQTLAADQERERTAAAERDASLAAAAAALASQRAQAEAAAHTLQAARALLKPEPAAGGGSSSSLRFCLPTGAKLNRRFAAHETLAAVRAYLTVYFAEHGIAIRSIGLSTSFPRRTFNDDDSDALTLLDAGFGPQAVLMVQDLDA